MLLRVAVVRTDVSEELTTYNIRVTRVGEIGTTSRGSTFVLRLLVAANVVPSSPLPFNVMVEAMSSSETSVLTSFPQHHIREDVSLHFHRC
jgi:hypothetical protein